MALNDKFQLTNYGSEVQEAIDNALIHLPAEIALKAYRDEVLVKNQTIPYTPIGYYNPATKGYVDDANTAIANRLDDEIARSTAADINLNEKQVLTYQSTYKYLNLGDISSSTQALVDENALDQKLSELSLGFFVYYQILPETGQLVEPDKLPEEEAGKAVNPYIVVKTQSELPTSDVPDNALALTLNDDTTVNVMIYTNSSWSIFSTPTIKNGWLFASTIDDKGYYWFVNTWNLIDMNVDMSQYYTKTETDSIVANYALNSTVGDLDSLTTTNKVSIVEAINSLKTLTDTKDTLPEIASHSVLANITSNGSKPLNELLYDNAATENTLALRTASGTIKAAEAIEDDDLTTLAQVNDLVANVNVTGFQPVIAAGNANDIVAYSGTKGQLNTLSRVTTINNVSTNLQVPTAQATYTYVQNYKPTIITQGSNSINTTTNQLTFWIEQ